MRFRFDDEQLFEPPAQSSGRRDATTIDHARRVEYLKLIHDGVGRTTAATRLGIGHKAMARALAQSPGFLRAVEQIERVRAEKLFEILHGAALKGDTEAARFLLERYDRERERAASARARRGPS